VKTTVITMDGLGSRFLAYTKKNPKIMLPLYDKDKSKQGDPVLIKFLIFITTHLLF